MKNQNLKSKPKTIGKPKTERRVAVQRMVRRRALLDKERKITLTPRFIAALEEVIRAELAMMQPSELWKWGKVTINDLASSVGLQWEFGADEDKPNGMKGDAMVIVA